MNRIGIFAGLALLSASCGSSDKAENPADTSTTAPRPTFSASASGATALPSQSLSGSILRKFSTKRFGEMNLQFLEDGIFREDTLSCSRAAVDHGDCKPFEVRGTYSVQASTITLVYANGPCEGLKADYDAKVGANFLTLSRTGVDDCVYRKAWYEGLWDAVR